MGSPRAEWEAFCERGELAFQVTPGGEPVWPPRAAEPPLAWRVSAGRGTVHATTVLRPRDGVPRNLAMVDLDEGPRLLTRVEGVDPADVRIGMRVHVRFDGAVPVFAP